MNITQSLAEYLIDEGFGTALGTDIFIGGIPQEAPSASWWLVSAGGSPTSTNQTGEKFKTYLVDIFYRNLEAQDVYNELQSLEIELNKSHCAQLSGFDTMEIEATLFPTDNDIDLEERTVGTIQVTIKTYYKE
jgi:hypothetical protein